MPIVEVDCVFKKAVFITKNFLCSFFFLLSFPLFSQTLEDDKARLLLEVEEVLGEEDENTADLDSTTSDSPSLYERLKIERDKKELLEKRRRVREQNRLRETPYLEDEQLPYLRH